MAALVITLIGPDRPGLVGLVADVVREHDGNWLESRMAHLAGQFAGIVQVDVDSSQLDSLIASLKQLENRGLRFMIEHDRGGAANDHPPGTVISLSVVGNDRPGIVSEVSRVLTDCNVNVEDFSTQCSSAPVAGGALFRADARLCLPPGLTIDALQQALECIAADLMVDISLGREE